MNTGIEESFEIWFLPRNQAAYRSRILNTDQTLEMAEQMRGFFAERMDGDIEIVRVRIDRVRIAPRNHESKE